MDRCSCETAIMRITSIDIGTNTVLLLVADIDAKGTISPLAYKQRIPRLGRDVDAQKLIRKPAFERIADILREYTRISKQLNSEHLIACATSAVRDATNREGFLAYIKAETGIEVELLTGEEEALCAYRGAISSLLNLKRTIAVIDIGGGSTEITLGTRDEIQKSVSLDIGSVRITERYFRHDPPLDSELESATELVQTAMYELEGENFAYATIVGVAGTATTLASLDQRLVDFDRTKISGYKLSKKAIDSLYRRLRTMNVDEILSLSNVTKGRADILTAGTLILREFMKKARAESIIVSEGGVRYGLALREWERLQQKKKFKNQTSKKS